MDRKTQPESAHKDSASNGRIQRTADPADMSQLDLALDYLRRGWTVIDLPHGRKEPGRKDWQLERPDQEELRRRFGNGARNISVLPGPVSDNLIDLDFDHLLLARNARGRLPETGLVFGRPGKPDSHWLYRSDRLPKTKRFVDPTPKAGGGMGVIGEFRTSPTLQTVLPNSQHPSGEEIRWVRYEEPADVDGDALYQEYALLCAETLLEFHWPSSGRHSAALALAGGLLRVGWGEGRIVALLEHLCRDTARPGEIEAIVADTARKLDEGDAVTGWPTLEEHVPVQVIREFQRWAGIRIAEERPKLTDLGNSERFLARFGEDVLYNAVSRRWLLWTQTHWRDDQRRYVEEMAKEVIRAIPLEAKDAKDVEERDKILKWATASQQGSRLETMLKRAQTVKENAVVPGELDPDPWLLNVANGTLDLRKMELREHRRDDRITKLVPIAYDPAARCPRFERFIAEVTRGNENLAGYLQRLIGYTLTGITTEKMFPLFWGEGDTGKTTLIKVILALLGPDYSRVISEAAIKLGKDGIPNDIAGLPGTRAVIVSETTEGLPLAEGLIKAMTGRNVLTARFLYGEFFSFVPEFKLYIETNHKPHIKGTDTAIWNRVKLIPFTNVVPKDRQDPELDTKLKEELPGILNWALDGCLQWQLGGLQEPEEVRAATDEYREESDTVGTFLTECATSTAGVRTRAGTVYARYKSFTEDRGLRPLGDQRFSDAMRSRGFVKRNVGGYGHWVDLELRPLITLVDGVGKEAAEGGVGE